MTMTMTRRMWNRTMTTETPDGTQQQQWTTFRPFDSYGFDRSSSLPCGLSFLSFQLRFDESTTGIFGCAPRLFRLLRIPDKRRDRDACVPGDPYRPSETVAWRSSMVFLLSTPDRADRNGAARPSPKPSTRRGGMAIRFETPPPAPLRPSHRCRPRHRCRFPNGSYHQNSRNHPQWSYLPSGLALYRYGFRCLLRRVQNRIGGFLPRRPSRLLCPARCRREHFCCRSDREGLQTREWDASKGRSLQRWTSVTQTTATKAVGREGTWLWQWIQWIEKRHDSCR
mmetsp:Transcript_6452/g.16040  ORF Transcript_6452/g.16040 Transcript_6452/m.16040 type:complete len:282 (+) Transcript_6452:10469-11314(+)